MKILYVLAITLFIIGCLPPRWSVIESSEINFEPSVDCVFLALSSIVDISEVEFADPLDKTKSQIEKMATRNYWFKSKSGSGYLSYTRQLGSGEISLSFSGEGKAPPKTLPLDTKRLLVKITETTNDKCSAESM